MQDKPLSYAGRQLERHRRGAPEQVVLGALICSLIAAAAKYAATMATGSTAMLTEMVHSLVDASSQALLFYGLNRAARWTNSGVDALANAAGDLYFWSYGAGVLLFAMGAGLAISQGMAAIADPHPVLSLPVALLVLAMCATLQCVTVWRMRDAFGPLPEARGLLAELRALGNPTQFTILLETLAGLTGIAMATCGLILAQGAGLPEADGASALLIGLVLAAVAAFFSTEIKVLLSRSAATGAPSRKPVNGGTTAPRHDPGPTGR